MEPVTDPKAATFNYAALDLETRVVVQQRTSEIKSLMKRSAQDIIEIGAKFAEVRDLLRHNKAGGFEGWIEAEGWQRGTAYNFIHIHEAFGNIPNFGQLDLVLSALYKLASPSTPALARDEVLHLAETGEKVTVKETQQIIDAHKAAPLDNPAWFANIIQGKWYLIDPVGRILYATPYDIPLAARNDIQPQDKGRLRPEQAVFILGRPDIFRSYLYVDPTIPVEPPASDESISPDAPEPEEDYTRQYDPKRDGPVKCPACDMVTVSWIAGRGGTWVCACGHRMNDDAMTPYEPPSSTVQRAHASKALRQARVAQAVAEENELAQLREEKRQWEIERAKLVTERDELRLEVTRLKSEVIRLRGVSVEQPNSQPAIHIQ